MAEANRKLAAILSADVAGYSRLMGADEEATVAALNACRNIFKDEIKRRQGRVVDTAGDSVLAEFPSVVEAVRTAVQVQQALAQRNEGLPEDRRMEFRIGVNLGDVIEQDDGTIYGDGVNIAARLENLATPGGINISGTAFDQVRGKLDFGFDFLGEQEVKNIDQPVRAYRVLLDGSAGNVAGKPASEGFGRKIGIAAAAILVVLVVAGVAVWKTTEPPLTPSETVAERPSIAVLPFRNLSGDPEQRYFGEGLAEDIVTDLSKVTGLLVISSNSSFGLSAKLPTSDGGFRDLVSTTAIAGTLNVRYILQGSVRRAENLVRLNVRLLDSTTGRNIWSERYDRDMTDIFAVQDEITREIVAALKVTFTDLEDARVAKRYTSDIAAYDYYLRGRRLQSDVTREVNREARRLLEKAIELDPSFAAAYAELSLVLWESWYFSWTDDAEAVKQRAGDMAMKAASLDDGLPEVHTYLSWTYLWNGAYEKAVAHGRRAIEINPNYANGYLYLSHVLTYSGEPEEGVRVGLRGMPLDPYSAYHFLYHIADSYWLIGDYDKAITSLNEAIRQRPNFVLSHAWLAAIYAELDRLDEARAAAAEVMRINPDFTAGIWRNLGYKDRSIARRVVDGMRKAGLRVPDEPEAS